MDDKQRYIAAQMDDKTWILSRDGWRPDMDSHQI